MPKQVAVVGMGHWGKNLVRNFHGLNALACVCDEEAGREAAVKEQYPGVSFTTDFGELLNDKDLQAVALATPAARHYAMARAALEAGKDVYVEKPLALQVEQGEELVQLAKEKGRILMVGHILRYHGAVEKLYSLVQEGALGRIRYFYSNRLSMGKIRTEENILWSFAPHDISVLLALLGGEPLSVTCEGASFLSSQIPDVTMSQLTFPNGVHGHIFVSWLHPFKEQRLVIVGSEKMAVFEDTAENKLVLYPHRVEWKNQAPTAVKAEAEVVEFTPTEPLRAECAHFLECLETRQAPRTDGEEGLRVLRVLEACEKALLKQAPQPLEEQPWFAHETAAVDSPCSIGKGTKIWHFSHVMKNARIGQNCILGQNCNIDAGVVIGDNVKIQNNVSVYNGAEIEDDVFLGPSCVLTNVTNPRSQVNRHRLYEKTRIRRGATIGANSTIVCGVTIGRYAFVGAGAVVTGDVPDYALMVGNPARQQGWMSRMGHRLQKDEAGQMVCPESGHRYEEKDGLLRNLDLDEEAPLPEELKKGQRGYDDFKK